MPTLKISVPHSLSRQEALGRIKDLLSQVKAKFGDRVANLRENWTEDLGEFGCTIMGFDVSGAVRVEAGHVHIEGKYPFAAIPFKTKIENTILERAKSLLS